MAQNTPARAQGAGPGATPVTKLAQASPKDEWVDVDSGEWVDVGDEEWVDIPVEEPAPSKGIFDTIDPFVEKYFTAPEFVRKGAAAASEWLTTPTTSRKRDKEGKLVTKPPIDLSKIPVSKRAEVEKLYRSEEFETRADSRAAFLGGAIEGAAEQLSPGQIVLSALGGGEVAAFRGAQRAIQAGKLSKAGKLYRGLKATHAASRAHAVPIGIESVGNVLDSEATPLERISAVPGVAASALMGRSRMLDYRKALKRTPVGIDVKVSDLGNAKTYGEGPKLLEPPIKQAGSGKTEGAGGPKAPKKGPSPEPPRQGEVVLSENIPQMMLKLKERGFVVIGATPEGHVRMAPKDAPIAQDVSNEGPVAFNKLTDYKNPNAKIAVIDDSPAGMWQGYAEDGGDLPTIIRYVETPSRGVQPSHGPLTPEEAVKLQEEGYQIVNKKDLPPEPIETPTREGDVLSKLGGQVPDEPSFARFEDETDIVKAREKTRIPMSSRSEVERSFRQDQLNMADEITDPDARQAELDRIKGMTERGPDEMIKIIRMEGHPELAKAERIYAEQNPEQIALNFHNAIAAEREVYEALRKPGLSADERHQLENAHDDLGMLVGLAGEKYARTSQRILEGDVSFSRPVDESGQPIETKDFTPEELAARKKQIATDWYKARLQARALGIDDRKFRHLDDLRQAIIAMKAEPSFAGDRETGMDIGNPRDMIEIFRNTYSKEVSSVAAKELIQNALDATKGMGREGHIVLKIDDKQKLLSVSDNGPGLLPDEFEELYLKLSASGKRGKGLGTIGELGVGKVSYLLGGETVAVTSVAKDPTTGQLIMTEMIATPEELLSKTAKLEISEIDPSSIPIPTGITTVVKFRPKADMGESSQYIDKFLRYSTREPTITLKRISDYGPLSDKIHHPKPYTPLKALGAGEVAGSTKWKISIPIDASVETNIEIPLVLTNRGMFQGVDSVWVGKGDYPDHLVIELDPTVVGTSEDYPLTAPVRESLKYDVKREIQKWIQENIVKKAVQDRLAEMGRIYQGMTQVRTRNGMNVLYDDGGRLTFHEMGFFQNSPALQEIGQQLVKTLAELSTTTSQDMLGLIDEIGFLFADKVGGVNFANPLDTKKFAVLVNVFESMLDRSKPNTPFERPDNAARRITETALHEFTHMIVRNEGAAFTWAFAITHGDLPLEFQLEVSRGIRSALTGGGPDYTDEVKKLLRIYLDSRGRGPTQKDSLVAERNINSFTGTFGPSPIRFSSGLGGTEDLGPNRIVMEGYGRASKSARKEMREGMLAGGYQPTGYSDAAGNPIWERPPEQQRDIILNAWNLSRGMQSVDLPFITSAGLRQGLPLFGLSPITWMKAWGKAARAYGENYAYEGQMTEISMHPNFRRGQDAAGNETPSFAEEAGLAMSDFSNLTNREEVIQGQWAEKIPNWILPGYSWHVKRSNKAFTAFLNTARAGTFNKFVSMAAEWAEILDDPSLNPYTNKKLAKQIAWAINILSGKGPLKIKIGPNTVLSAEGAAKELSYALYSPKLQASRIALLNPLTYINVHPFVRNMLLRGMLSAIGGWITMISLLEMAGAEVSRDPNSADFMKSKINNTRLDPGQGFQQYIVLFSRLRGGPDAVVRGLGGPEHITRFPFSFPTPPYGEPFTDPGGGMFTPSTGTRRPTPIGQGFRAITEKEILENLAASKIHPSARIMYNFLDSSDDKPFFVGDQILQTYAPMFTSDLNAALEEDPGLAAVIATLSSMGMGSQTYSRRDEKKPEVTPLLDKMGIPASQYDLKIGARRER